MAVLSSTNERFIEELKTLCKRRGVEVRENVDIEDPGNKTLIDPRKHLRPARRKKQD